jgi:hypothetical protein
MPKQPKLLNVKSYLEWSIGVIEAILIETKLNRPDGTRVAPLFHMELRKLNFIARAILRKHTEKKTRKDIRL